MKTVLAILLILVLCVFIYVVRSTYTARAGGDEQPSASDASPRAQRPSTPPGASPQTEMTEQGSPATGGVTPPAADSIAPNPPNGVTYGGSGHFQLYRQGDITWRLNTSTGATCIVFATNEEWKQPRVRRAACPKPGRD